MPQRIDVPGIGVVEFPDGMSDEQITSAIKANSDPYKTSAQQEYQALKAKGVPVEQGLASQFAHGATLGASDELLAGLNTPIEMYRAGTLNPVEGYRRAKAWEDVRAEEAAKQQGLAGTAAEIGGGLFTGVGAAKAGLTLAQPGMKFLPRVLANTAEGAGYGGLAGFLGGGNSLGERISGAESGTLGGAALGGIGSGLWGAVGPIARATGRTISSNVRARLYPEAEALSQTARGISESGKTSAQITSDVQAAAAEGQPSYTIADAMGYPGQRMMSGVTRSPGEGRTAAADYLEARQGGQAKRVANALTEGFDAPVTAEQAAKGIAENARQVNAPSYKAAYAAGDRPIWSDTGPNSLERLSSSPTIQSAMRGAERKWADWQIIDGYGGMNPPARVANGGLLRFSNGGLETYPNLQYWDYVGRDLAGKAQTARAAGNMQEASRYGQLEQRLKSELDRLVPQFQATRAGARDFFAQRNAIEAGQTAATRGRTENTIPAFRAMPQEQQAAYRVGYVDPLIAQVQGGAIGVNKARPFTSDAFRAESQAVAPMTAGNLMARRLARENTMFETRNAALGGSKTADNFADRELPRVSPSIAYHILHGNLAAAGALGLGAISNALHGSTPRVRAEIAKLLLEHGGHPTVGAKLTAASEKYANRQAARSALARALLVAGSTQLH